MLVLRSKLPREWAIREYKPDYGIDVTVELFRYLDAEETKADTLGEMFFGQLKSQKTADIQTITVHPRYNVEKMPLSENRKEKREIQALRFEIDTDELLTVQAMGAGLPVILFLIPLDTKRIFFVCLNDLIDKVIIPADPKFPSTESKVIFVPLANEITNDPESLTALRFYAKRSKLSAAFGKFTYQLSESDHYREGIMYRNLDDLAGAEELRTIGHFLDTIRRYDFWETTPMWLPISDCFRDITTLQELIARIKTRGTLDREDFESFFNFGPEFDSFDEEQTLRFFLSSKITETWRKLANLNNMHEEICREWFLPTYMAQDLSYPREVSV